MNFLTLSALLFFSSLSYAGEINYYSFCDKNETVFISKEDIQSVAVESKNYHVQKSGDNVLLIVPKEKKEQIKEKYTPRVEVNLVSGERVVFIEEPCSKFLLIHNAPPKSSAKE